MTINYEERLAMLKNCQMKRKFYCDKCGWIDIQNTKIKELKEVFDIKNEKIEVDGTGRLCEVCNERINDHEIDDQNLIKAYRVYKKKHKMLLPEEITAIYNKYGLTAKKLALVLGLGDHTIYRYERGALQDKSHDALLKFIRDPKCFLQFIVENEIDMPEYLIEDLKAKVEGLIDIDGLNAQSVTLNDINLYLAKIENRISNLIPNESTYYFDVYANYNQNENKGIKS